MALTPLAIADMLWLGPRMLGAGIGEDSVFVLAGLATFVGGALPLLCLGLAVPAWRGSRGARIAGAALALAIGAFSLTSLHLLSPLSWLGPGRWLLTALALAASVTLLWAALGERGGEGVGRPGALAPALAGGVLVALLLAGAAIGRVGEEIPSAPSGVLADELRGGERLRGEPLRAAPPGPQPGLLAGQGSNIHNDWAMSDAYFGRRVIDPADSEIRSFRALGDCASILFDRRGRLVAVCVGGRRTVAHLLDPETLEPQAERRIADRSPGLDFATDFAGGGYAVLDDRGRLVVPGADGVIDRFRIASGADAAIVPADSFDVGPTMEPDEPITSALPDSSRRLWYVGAEGTVGLLDPRTGSARSIRFPGTEIENSLALAPDGGAFVVTSEQLVRLAAGAGGRPRVVWAEDYDNGERRKPGQTSRASGTTPTVMLGGRYVVITDNAEPRMNVQVYAAGRRHRGRRLACEAPVFAPGESATENSLIAAGRSIFVESNYGYGLLKVLGGHSSEPGAARVDFDPRARRCELVWSNDEIHIPSVVSKVAVADGTMLTYTKPESAAGVDAWYFTALDAGTGEVLWERLAGSGALANNHYAALYVGPGGNLYVGTLGGVIAMVAADR